MLAPYLIIFIIGITGSAFFFPNCEISILALSSLGIVKPFSVFGHEIVLSDYHSDIPWLLACFCALGSTIGSSLFYFIGKGSRNISGKLKKQLDRFDFARFEKSSIIITFASSAFSLPPFTILSLAAGMTHFSLWKYLPVSFVGKATRFAIVAYTGGGIVHLIQRFFN